MLHLDLQISDGIGPHLQKTLAALQNTRPLMQRIGETLTRYILAHFTERDAQPNVKGWPKRHFWSTEGIRKTALTRVDESMAEVSIASPAIAHKLTGGVVTPKRGRALAIPATAEAYKAIKPSAMAEDRLEFIPLNLGGLVGMLVERQHDTLRKTKKGFRQGETRGGNVWFWLMAKVTHKPDPNALPEDAALEAQAFSVADNYLQERLAP
jgi:hypothetical protein